MWPAEPKELPTPALKGPNGAKTLTPVQCQPNNEDLVSHVVDTVAIPL
jgi:hypothetical protein